MAPDVVEVRMLGAGDAALLGNVADDVFDEAVNPPLAAEFVADPRHHIAVALDGGRIVGFASGVHYIHPDKPAELFVDEVGVAAPYRRRGIGRRLLRALFDHAAALGCASAWVGTEPDNAAALGLYAAVGGNDPEPFLLVSFALAGRG